MPKLFSILLIVMFLFNSGCSAEKRDNQNVDNKAKALNDSAMKILRSYYIGKANITDIRSAISLLDSAILIDSSYHIALHNKVENLKLLYFNAKDTSMKRQIAERMLNTLNIIINKNKTIRPVILIKRSKVLENLNKNRKVVQDLNHAEFIIDSTLTSKTSKYIKPEIYLMKLYILCKKGESTKANRFFSENREKIENFNYGNFEIINNDTIECNTVKMIDF